MEIRQKDDAQELELICGACGEENKFPISFPVECQACKKPLTNQGPYTRLGPLMAGVILAMGAGGMWTVSAFTGDNRYPLLVEHAIIESCISESKKPLPTDKFLKKRDICACALEETQGELEAEVWAKERGRFISVFKSYVKFCSPETG